MEIDCVYLSYDTCQEETGGIVYLRLFALLCGYICTVESVAWVYTICILSPSCALICKRTRIQKAPICNSFLEG